MKIGVLKEPEPREYRLPVIPAGAARLLEHGPAVLVETGAGTGAGYPDAACRAVATAIAETAEQALRDPKTAPDPGQGHL